jgi:alpha-tubulin suppressor-like RCC1 family protein
LGDKLVDAEDMVVLTPQQLKLPRSTIFQGDANSLQRISAIACGTFTSAASTTDGKLFVWGSAAAGNGQTLDREDAKLKSVSVVSEFPIDKIACGTFGGSDHASVETTGTDVC